MPAEQVPGVSGKDFPNLRGCWIFPKLTYRVFLKLTTGQEEEIEDEWIPSDVSDHEESDMSDQSDYEGNEFSTTLDSEDEDLDIKSEILYDDEKKESSSWLDEDCGDLHQERTFLVFESKLKELFFSLRALSKLCTKLGKRVIKNQGISCNY